MFLCLSLVSVAVLITIVAYLSYFYYRVDLRLANLVDGVRLSSTYSKIVALNRKDRRDIHSRIKNRERTIRLLGANRVQAKAWKSCDQFQARKYGHRNVLVSA